MGRKKLELKRLETLKDRSCKYSKRKKGILKKAEEMSILCDIDIALLLFSPTNKPCIFTRPRSLSKILERLHNVPFRYRQERKRYTTKLLRKMYNKNMNSGEVPSGNYRDGMHHQENIKVTKLRELSKHLVKRKTMLRDWVNPCFVADLNRLDIMEDHLFNSLNYIRRMKFGIYHTLK